ncbi:bacillithiol biosynthesis cysteine-adding enzyme BshC [Niabella ginsengisoli]|uniref:bacillithiol biosynthesis cysteine-adding enzyme BshC n=1 Tax=Niabella ginsengisoli TaxID=522298 RepID=UPI0021D4418E|nr:bacillithiol biosynthesis cysteine-adding enzyme BshC [Niabella ginsengisoli]
MNGEKLTWQTSQTGAVGRMKVDESLLDLIKRIESEIGVLPHGEEVTSELKKYYKKGTNIQDATLGFVNYLFGAYGLIVVIPDNAVLKSVAADLFKDELLHQRSSVIVEKTSQNLVDAGYKAQAHGRDINLFYLKDDGQRLRIERKENKWYVLETDINFDKDAIMLEVESHPERFSPNVILRGIFQEMILPNIAFIGGGGELAYWLELKEIFNHYKVSYPILVLRNSFLIVNKKQLEKATKLGFDVNDLFKNRLHLKSKWVTDHSENDVSVVKSLGEIQAIFDDLSRQATAIDITLKGHIYALQKQQEKKIVELGKKFLRAEKRNHSDAMRQIDTLKQQLFPFDNLQERIDNILPYLAIWGSDFIDALYQNSKTLEQDFIVLEQH